MRTFLALPVQPELKTSLESYSRRLADVEGVKPVEPEHFHLTIQFLGNCTFSTFNQLERLFHHRLSTPGPFSLEVRGAGAFPNLESPSVLWAGVEKSTDLVEFVDSVQSVTEQLGFEPDSRDYHPHITLGRVKQSKPKTVQTLTRWVQSLGDKPIGGLEADHLVLFESETKSEGSIYHQRSRWPLEGLNPRIFFYPCSINLPVNRP